MSGSDPGRPTVAVLGGGIAGVAAATVLAERGIGVTLVEREAVLGGRVAGWQDRLATGEPFEMGRGFHAFFRQYYNLRALLRRIDPELSLLAPVRDYPVLAADGRAQSFRGLPRRAPLNLIAASLRIPGLDLAALRRANGRAAFAMLAFDMEPTFAAHDHRSAAEYLDSLNFPAPVRQVLFDVFAHSFFNPEAELSAAELLMMFHFYFARNREGLLFDVARRPFATAIWRPFEHRLAAHGVDVRLATAARRIARRDDGRWDVNLEGAGTLTADGVVLALPVEPLRRLVTESPSLGDAAWRVRIAALRVTRPFAVWRLWLDRPPREGRPVFAGTTGAGILDNVSLLHLFEDQSRAWAAQTGGAVVELHGYALPPEPDEASLRRELLAGLHRFFPELHDARILDQRFMLRRDCPAFAPGSFAERPTVETPAGNVALAGDLVRLPIPTALMERAATAGFMAANVLLARHGMRPEPIRSVPERGLLWRWNARAVWRRPPLPAHAPADARSPHAL